MQYSNKWQLKATDFFEFSINVKTRKALTICKTVYRVL